MILLDKLRWRIAELLNLLPGQCWADLVDWPLRRGRLELKPNRRCRDDVARCGTCYCGKLRTPEADARMRAGGAPAGIVVSDPWSDR